MTGNNSNSEDGDKTSDKSPTLKIPLGVMLAPSHVQEKCDYIIDSAVDTALKSNTDYSIRKKLKNYQYNPDKIQHTDDTTNNAYKLIENNLQYFEQIFNKRKDERKKQTETGRSEAKEARNKYYFSRFIDVGKNISNLWNRIKQASKQKRANNYTIPQKDLQKRVNYDPIPQKDPDDKVAKSEENHLVSTKNPIKHAKHSTFLDELEAQQNNRIKKPTLLQQTLDKGLLHKLHEEELQEAFKGITVSDAQEGGKTKGNSAKQQTPSTGKKKYEPQYNKRVFD